MRGEDWDRWWSRAEAMSRGRIWLAMLAMLGLIFALNAVAGPTFAFGGLYGLTVCAAAWLLGFRAAVSLGLAAIAGSLAMNGAGGPYAGPPLEAGSFDAVLSVSLRAVSLLASAALISRVRSRYDVSRERADHDPLTGLANSRAFRDAVTEAVARAGRRETVVALAYLDLDDFKSLNDRLGHAAGDVTLRAVAEAARAAVRTSDCVGRLGGDEFALLIEARDDGEARAAVARVYASLQRLMPVSFSMGAVVSKRGDDAAALIEAADHLMYSSKRRAKGTLTLESEQPGRMAA